VTSVAFRAPETTLKQPIDEKTDMWWSFGCLIYELLTGTQLFGVCLMGDDKEEDTVDDHLPEMHDIFSELPENIMTLWPRAHKWFGEYMENA
jgi:serine/threonine protein kinase